MSPTQPAAIADDQTFTVRRQIYVEADNEQVWRVVTDPALIAEWFGELQLTGSGVGARGTINWPGEPAVPITIEAMDPPHTIRYRWRNQPGSSGVTLTSNNSTNFTFTLTPEGTGTTVEVVETGFQALPDPHESLNGHKEGWDEKLDQLADHLRRP